MTVTPYIVAPVNASLFAPLLMHDCIWKMSMQQVANFKDKQWNTLGKY